MPPANRRIDCESHELARRVRNFLHHRSHLDLAHLEVEAEQDVVVLRGRVGSSYARVLASECCQRVAGVRRVVNETTLEA